MTHTDSRTTVLSTRARQRNQHDDYSAIRKGRFLKDSIKDDGGSSGRGRGASGGETRDRRDSSNGSGVGKRGDMCKSHHGSNGGITCRG